MMKWLKLVEGTVVEETVVEGSLVERFLNEKMVVIKSSRKFVIINYQNNFERNKTVNEVFKKNSFL